MLLPHRCFTAGPMIANGYRAQCAVGHKGGAQCNATPKDGSNTAGTGR